MTPISTKAEGREDQKATSPNGDGPMANVRAYESDEKQLLVTMDA
jgi:hypothetical protein